MNKLLFLLVATTTIVTSCSQKIDYKKAEEYIRESEKQWAESVVSGDTNVIKRILADDFLGVDTEGDQYNKQTMVNERSSRDLDDSENE